MAFSFTNLFKKESGKSTQPLTMDSPSMGSRGGLDDEDDSEDGLNAESEPNTEKNNHMAANPFEQSPGATTPPPAQVSDPQSPFAINGGASPFTQQPPAAAAASPFQQQPPAGQTPGAPAAQAPQSPFGIQQAAFDQPPAGNEGNGRQQELEDKGFRPLSSLPGGQVPSAGPGLTGLSPIGQPQENGQAPTNGASPFEMPTQEAASAASPFEVQPPAAAAPAPAPAGSPFEMPQSPAAPAQTSSPFEVMPQPEQTPPPAAPANPFEAPAPQQQAAPSPQQQPPAPEPLAQMPASNFGAETPSAPMQMPEVAPPAASLPNLELQDPPMAELDTSDDVELGLKEVLLSVPPEKLGFDALKVPDDVTATFGMDKIKPQLSTGRVVLRLQEVVDACQERFRPAFAKADVDTLVNLPMESIFHQLPTDAQTETPAASPFGFDQPATPPTTSPPENPFGAPEVSTSAPVAAGASPFGFPTEEPQAAPVDNSSPFLNEDEPTPTPAPSANPFAAPIDAAPAAAMSMPLPAEPAPVAPAQPAPADDQMQLRALLMTSGQLDAKRVVSLCEEMPGVDACCLLSENGTLQASSINANDFATQAQSITAGLGSVTNGLGLGSSNDFTLQTQQGTVTFFKATPIYLGVQHSEATFQPGVREKLTLISRELAQMS